MESSSDGFFLGWTSSDGPISFAPVTWVSGVYDRWRAWTRKLNKDRDNTVAETSDVTSEVYKTDDLPKYIENYVAIVKSNLRKVYGVVSGFIRKYDSGISAKYFLWPYCQPKSSSEEINTLIFKFEKACQGLYAFQHIHKHSTYAFYEEALLDIFCRLEEVDIFTVELLHVADFCKQLSSDTKTLGFDEFLDDILSPMIESIRDPIFKFNESVQVNLVEFESIKADLLKYAASIRYNIICIIIALLLFICGSSLGSATDMKQLMIFATVIHLIISGDVEINPGPQSAARERNQRLVIFLEYSFKLKPHVTGKPLVEH